MMARRSDEEAPTFVADHDSFPEPDITRDIC
jgi:hypothetical protein